MREKDSGQRCALRPERTNIGDAVAMIVEKPGANTWTFGPNYSTTPAQSTPKTAKYVGIKKLALPS